MRKLNNKKLFIGIIIGILITSGIFYIVDQGRERPHPKNTQTCQNLSKLPNNATKKVTKVIDGDTFIIEGGQSVRLLGIDTDERGYPCYDEAKKKLEQLALNKEVTLQKGATNCDQYGRYLRYPFVNGNNVSLQLVKEGLAIARFDPKQKKYKDKIIQAEQEAQDDNKGCKWKKTAPEEQNSTSSQIKSFNWDKLTGKVIGACHAGKHEGKKTIVQGKVAHTYHDRKSNTVFLNFNKPYPNHCFNAVIFSSNLHKFVESPEDYYKNKTVRVKGKVKMYKGKPEIILEAPSQIEVGE